MVNEDTRIELSILESSMTFFWRRGYDAANLNELSEWLGLNEMEIRRRFGDKRGLFDRAIQQYLSNGFEREMQRFIDMASPLASLHAIFDELIASCFDYHPLGQQSVLFSEALTIAPYDPEFQMALRDVLVKVEALLARLVRKGQDYGEIATKIAAEDLARLLLGALIGFRVLSRSFPRKDDLESIARATLAVLSGTEMSG